MNVISLLKDNWQEVMVLAGTISSFFIGRKSKKNADFSGELENIKTVREIEAKLLVDMRDQIFKLIAQNDALELIIDKQSVKLREYQVKYGKL
jgi:hypothetical protein